MKALKLITTGLFLAFTGIVSAQQEATNMNDKTFSFGVKGGVNFATITSGDDDFDSPDSRTSFHVGVLAEMPVSDIFSIQAEALYSGQGFDLDFEGPDNDNAEVQLDYINVPILAKFYITEGLSIEAGPQFSFLVNEEFDFNPNSNDGDIDLEDTAFEAEEFEFGVAAGITFQTNMGLFASGRYTRGFTDIYNDVNVQNSVFQISVGYKF